jgi:hypothetical protein
MQRTTSLLLSLSLLLTFLPSQVTGVNVLRNRAAARTKSWVELEEIFRQGTVEGGIPEGYSYG